jgi:polysaccharide pyruvyl transferase WcaK-like protein
VGSAEFHVGDQAMLDANLATLAELAPTASVTVLGRSATRTQITQGVARADGVLLSGGGNLSSSWPDLLEQRITLLEAAAAAGVPLVTGGQTIGPEVHPPQRGRLEAALRTVALLGVRDRPSGELARAWGVPAQRLVHHVDDAFFLPGSEPRDPALLALAAGGFIGVTLDGSYATAGTRAGLQSLAAQLGTLATQLDLPILAIPHVGTLGTRDGQDSAAHRRLAALARLSGARVVESVVPTVAEAVWLHRAARLTVSTRYHPLVFGSSVGVPCLGLARDHYTRIKLDGALAHVGGEEWVQDVAAAEAGGLLVRGRELLARRRAGDTRLAEARATRLLDTERSRARRLAGLLTGNVPSHDDRRRADDHGAATGDHCP